MFCIFRSNLRGMDLNSLTRIVRFRKSLAITGMPLDVLGFTRFTIIFMKSERYILFLFCFLSFFARRGGGDGKKV